MNDNSLTVLECDVYICICLSQDKETFVVCDKCGTKLVSITKESITEILKGIPIIIKDADKDCSRCKSLNLEKGKEVLLKFKCTQCGMFNFYTYEENSIFVLKCKNCEIH